MRKRGFPVTRGSDCEGEGSAVGAGNAPPCPSRAGGKPVRDGVRGGAGSI